MCSAKLHLQPKLAPHTERVKGSPPPPCAPSSSKRPNCRRRRTSGPRTGQPKGFSPVWLLVCRAIWTRYRNVPATRWAGEMLPLRGLGASSPHRSFLPRNSGGRTVSLLSGVRPFLPQRLFELIRPGGSFPALAAAVPALSLACRATCRVRFNSCMNVLPQTEQSNGFSPV